MLHEWHNGHYRVNIMFFPVLPHFLSYFTKQVFLSPLIASFPLLWPCNILPYTPYFFSSPVHPTHTYVYIPHHLVTLWPLHPCSFPMLVWVIFHRWSLQSHSHVSLNSRILFTFVNEVKISYIVFLMRKFRSQNATFVTEHKISCIVLLLIIA